MKFRHKVDLREIAPRKVKELIEIGEERKIIEYELNDIEKERVINRWIREESEEDKIITRKNIERVLSKNIKINFYYLIEVCEYFHRDAIKKEIKEEKNQLKRRILRLFIEKEDLGISNLSNVEFYNKIIKQRIEEEIDIEDLYKLAQKYGYGYEKKRLEKVNEGKKRLRARIRAGAVLIEIKEGKYIFSNKIVEEYIKRREEEEIERGRIERGNVYSNTGNRIKRVNNKIEKEKGGREKKAIKLSGILTNNAQGYYKL